MRVLQYKHYWHIKEPRLHNDGDRCIEYYPRDGRWEFDGDFENPTFTPSLKSTHPAYPADNVPAWCQHIIVTKGQCYYCPDCTHSLAGETLDLLPFTETEIAFAKTHEDYDGPE